MTRTEQRRYYPPPLRPYPRPRREPRPAVRTRRRVWPWMLAAMVVFAAGCGGLVALGWMTVTLG